MWVRLPSRLVSAVSRPEGIQWYGGDSHPGETKIRLKPWKRAARCGISQDLKPTGKPGLPCEALVSMTLLGEELKIESLRF